MRSCFFPSVPSVHEYDPNCYEYIRRQHYTVPPVVRIKNLGQHWSSDPLCGHQFPLCKAMAEVRSLNPSTNPSSFAEPSRRAIISGIRAPVVVSIMPLATTMISTSDDWVDDTDDFGADSELLPRSERMIGDDVKEVIEYDISEDGYLRKTTKRFKVRTVTRTVSKAVAARKKWEKFGECAGKPPGLESGVSVISSEEIDMDWVEKNTDEDLEEEIDYEKMAAKDIQSRLKMERFRQRQEERRLGFTNWAQRMSMEAAAKDPSSSPGGGDDGGGASKGMSQGKYVPPSKRGGASGKETEGESMYSRDDSATVRVSNVSSRTSEADLMVLFGHYGSIRRIFLSKDKITGESKGFAFVAYQRVEDAKKCIEKLDGYGYDHLILRVEWSKPKEPREGAPTSSRPPLYGR
eukprot:Plantae.Rhodophyta-Hildenbrandia_rubra.ctg11857.p1 GENE.Plantae.Rhodophyta-Hildenbrandia_rubra.ctg11857~~Plantae.Rhodophyta-Hildenbrandia_rubra.ctg11857.p1  ORF type:complete len:406 (-),score=61.31 Plantae.Rhodophyta-Hildenbrandia_rubra.ctg11857:586-1803(-)